LRNIGLVIFYAGIASSVFGVLFGSVFGVEDWLPTLWLKPMHSISDLFRVSLYFGMGMVTLAIIINIINGIRKRDFIGIIFHKAGLVAAILYWCGIVMVSRYLAADQTTQSSDLVLIPVFFIGSLILLFLKEPLITLLRGKRKLYPEGVASGIIGGIVEILELILGLLANTVSFIRVAAFGLAHAGLFIAIFTLSDMLKGSSGGLLSIFVLVIGNCLIIALECLVVSIQGLRLEFYEFFSRFFQSGGLGYQPVHTLFRK
jgi:V/A-type H+-transporting ATPase subunit I